VDGAKIIKDRTGAPMGIGAPIRKVQSTFQEVYNVDAVTPDGSEFDHYFGDGETFQIGKTSVRVMFTPGHTPACVSYVVNEEAVFVGDTLFASDAGTARCDFPNGSAEQLYESVSKLLALPEATEMFLCHDYQPGGRELVYRTTVAEQRASNKHVKDGTSKEDYVTMRTERDATLNFPRLLYPSILLNIRGGRLPTPESNGKSYLKTPIQVKTDSAL
jgi:glyoxylase-like metal-dependent hydrolase (beta-lactamase superfamily II)